MFSKKFLILILTVGFFVIKTSYGQTICQKAHSIVKTAKKHHYSPIDINDNFSKIVFNQFLKTIDPYNYYFTKGDLALLKVYENQLDDEILNNDCDFYNKVTEVFKKRISFTDSLLQLLNNQPINFDSNDTLQFLTKTKFLTENELVQSWKNLLKFQILSTHFPNIDSIENFEKPTAKELALYQSKIVNRIKCNLNTNLNYAKSVEDFISTNYLKAVSQSFDPHSEFFTVGDEEEFTGSISKETLSFGFSIDKNDLNEFEITHIVPGSVAWKSNNINEEDVILEIKSINEEFIDLSCIPTNQLNQLINNNELLEAEFLIRKKSGEKINLKLKKEIIDVEENLINSYILEGEKKIGYIYLPSFYSSGDFLNMVDGCSDIIARELIKLKRKNIDGLILDLRNNTGGSLMEAMKLAGIFIDYGNLGVLDYRNEEPELIRDMNRGVIFNDALVVLINEYSASASELFAAAMQDYNRAVILGSISYGKSTSQVILPLNSYNYSLKNIDFTKKSNDGFIKLTLSKFYRITGDSFQKEGVIPDITLPSIFDKIAYGEKLNKTALNKSSIEKEIYYKPLKNLPIEILKNNSKNRVKESDGFKNIKIQNNEYLQIQNGYNIPLKFDYYIDFLKSELNKEDILKHFETNNYTIINNSIQDLYFSNDTEQQKESNKESIKKIKEDIYINESYLIIKDLITNLNK